MTPEGSKLEKERWREREGVCVCVGEEWWRRKTGNEDQQSLECWEMAYLRGCLAAFLRWNFFDRVFSVEAPLAKGLGHGDKT